MITEHPENVTARVGETVLIRCEYEGANSALPKWIINDVAFSPLKLPPWYMSTSKGLKISHVEDSMNNTKFICGFGSHVRSHAGYLTVAKQGDVPALLCLFRMCHADIHV